MHSIQRVLNRVPVSGDAIPKHGNARFVAEPPIRNKEDPMIIGFDCFFSIYDPFLKTCAKRYVVRKKTHT